MPSRRQIEFALATRLNPVARAWQKLADTSLAAFGTSISQGWALVHLERLGAETRQGELARAIGISEASLVRTLHQLEHAGLVTRRSDASDRRSNHLMLTEAGAGIAAAIDARLVALRREILQGIPDADLATTARILDKVAARIAERRGRP